MTSADDAADRDFIMLMHRDTTVMPMSDMWLAYVAGLRAVGAFLGGSAIGPGEAFRRAAEPEETSDQLGGYVRVRARNLAAARELLAGNPVFECGGTVEIRELPRE